MLIESKKIAAKINLAMERFKKACRKIKLKNKHPCTTHNSYFCQARMFNHQCKLFNIQMLIESKKIAAKMNLAMERFKKACRKIKLK